jgi:hypothetical protein
MPPEIATDQRPWVGTWTDVYMLGAVLFEVLYGFAPHRQPTVVDALRSASRNAWQFPAEISDRLRPYHEVFKPLLMRAMSGHPHERQLDAAAFADAIKTSLQHLDSAELSTEAASIYHEVECEEATAQQARQANLAVSIRSPQERYRAIAHAIALLGRALDRWPENPAARHYLVEAHLLHAHSSLLAGDLTLAQTHLEALQRLPEAWRPSPEQAQRAQPLYRRLQEAFDGQRRRRQTMTALQLGAAVLTLTIIVGSTVAMVLIDRARDQVETERNHLSKMLISTASDGIASELNRLLDPVRGALDASAQWAKAGHFDTDDPQALNSILIPLIDGFPVMSGIMRADDKGYEYMLLRTEYGWRSRSRAPDRPARFQKLDHGGEVLQTWTETIEYDPLTRPWYKGALNVAPGPDKANAIFWSEPYTFFSTQQPGVTASIAVESAKGRNFVFGIDLSLAEISAFTMKMPDSQHGKVFVLDANKRLIGLPRSGNLSTDEAIRGAFLAPVSSLGDPILDATMSQWSKLSDAQDRAFRVEASGQGWWAGFRSFALGGERSFWIGVISPETDFVGKDTPSTPQAVGQAGAPQ